MATSIRFTKGHGTGNDFVLYADPEGEHGLSRAQLTAIADRHVGVGGDGVIRAVRSARLADGSAALAEDPTAEWFMDYANSDGSISEMCGNGVRVFTEYLIASGLVELAVGAILRLGTRAGVRTVQRTADGYAVDMGRWNLSGGEPLVRARGLAVGRPGLGISVGNPHVVVAVASDEELDGIDLGTTPVLDPSAENGVNVEFVVPADPLVLDGVGRIRMRVHERGSGETLSCGTGAVAAAMAVRHWAGAGAPDEWRVTVPGGVLGVSVVRDEDGEHAVLSGPAVLVFEGELSV